eukprot:gene6164-6230_t
MDNDVLLSTGLFIFAACAVGYVFIYPILSGEHRIDKRRQAFQGSANARQVAQRADIVNRRKQVEGSLKDLANKQSKKKSVTLLVLIGQAGLNWPRKTYFIFSAVMAVFVMGLIFFITENILFALPGLIIGGLGFPRWMLSFLAKRRIKKFVEEFPNALDVITRGIKAGLPLGDCLRIIAAEAAEPVKSEFRRVVESQALGLTVPEAIERMAERVPVTETNFFSIVISIQSKAGGNLSEAIGNLSRVLRDRKKMKGKVQAMAMEAKASGAIIAGMPFIVATLVYLTSPQYMSLLWTTNMGRLALCGAAFWMSIGIFSMKKMINFDL